MHFLPKKNCFDPKKTYFAQSLQKVRKSRQTWYGNKIAYNRANKFRPIPNFFGEGPLHLGTTSDTLNSEVLNGHTKNHEKLTMRWVWGEGVSLTVKKDFFTTSLIWNIVFIQNHPCLAWLQHNLCELDEPSKRFRQVGKHTGEQVGRALVVGEEPDGSQWGETSCWGDPCEGGVLPLPGRV